MIATPHNHHPVILSDHLDNSSSREKKLIKFQFQNWNWVFLFQRISPYLRLLNFVFFPLNFNSNSHIHHHLYLYVMWFFFLFFWWLCFCFHSLCISLCFFLFVFFSSFCLWEKFTDWCTVGGGGRCGKKTIFFRNQILCEYIYIHCVVSISLWEFC